MRLNTLKPAPGAKQKHHRVGRGIGCGSGKTCGLGHKGQHARAGGYHKVGFEGGQMPMQRRLPKFGFHSMVAAETAEVRLDELQKLDLSVIDLKSLKEANIVSPRVKQAKIIVSGKISKAITLKGLRVTQGAKTAIEAAGGKVTSE